MKQTEFLGVTVSRRLSRELEDLSEQLGLSKSGVISALASDSLNSGLGADLKSGKASESDVVETAGRYDHRVLRRGVREEDADARAHQQGRSG